MLFDFFLLHDCWESSHFSGWLNANKVRANKIAYTILIVEQNVAAFLCCLKSLILMFLTNKCDQGEKTCLEFWNVNYLLSQESMNCWSVVRWLIWQETQALSQTGDRAICYLKKDPANGGDVGDGVGGNVGNVRHGVVVTRCEVEVVWGEWPHLSHYQEAVGRWRVTVSLLRVNRSQLSALHSELNWGGRWHTFIFLCCATAHVQ